MSNEKIDPAQYRRDYAPHFTADAYDPDAWADLAARCGMGYAVLTAKHHEGFCLYDSALTDYTARHATPAGRVLVRPLIDHATGTPRTIPVSLDTQGHGDADQALIAGLEAQLRLDPEAMRTGIEVSLRQPCARLRGEASRTAGGSWVDLGIQPQGPSPCAPLP